MSDREIIKRVRGIWFDPEKVRHQAGKIGIGSEEALEVRYIECHKSEKGITVVKNAWRGNRPTDKQYAQKLARCLGLQDYFPLEKTESQSSWWKKLITETESSDPFIRLISEDVDDLRHFSIPSDDKDEKRLPHYPLNTQWHLDLRGEKGQELFILLRSKDRFFQVAPIDGDNFSNKFDGDTLRYPSEGELEFTKGDGTGWRQFIVIRADKIETKIRNFDTGYECTFDVMELLAQRLLAREENENIAVDAYEFVLTDTDSPLESG